MSKPMWTGWRTAQGWALEWGVSHDATTWAFTQAHEWRYGAHSVLRPIQGDGRSAQWAVGYKWETKETAYRVRLSHLDQLAQLARARHAAGVLAMQAIMDVADWQRQS